MSEQDRCFTVSIRVAAVVVLWSAGVGLVALQTVGYPDVLGRWGMLLCIAGATLAVVHVSTRYHRMLRQAFELGRETGKRDAVADLHAVR